MIRQGYDVSIMLKIKSFSITRLYYFRIFILIIVFGITLLTLILYYPVQNDKGRHVFEIKNTEIQQQAFRSGHIYPSRGGWPALVFLFIDEYRLQDQKSSQKSKKNSNSTECFKKIVKRKRELTVSCMQNNMRRLVPLMSCDTITLNQ